MFDVQVKRIHEYKRQLLHALAILDEYLLIVEDGLTPVAPRVHIFAGKAAPGYHKAKLIIKLINNIAAVVNGDPKCGDWLKVIFIPDYKVSLAEIIIPGADLSEQISTAGMEASGTSNMKFAMNGALTIGTLDGANIEIREEAGADNFFLFGLTAAQIFDLKRGGYNPRSFYDRSPRLREVMDGLLAGRFTNGDRITLAPLVNDLLTADRYCVLADFDAYTATQAEVGRAYSDIPRWSRMSLLNTARSGKFSSDRTIREYGADIWKLPVSPA
jgi:starch phosphorylase